MLVPLVFTHDLHTLAPRQRHAPGEIDVVRHQHGMTGSEFEHETLVSRTLIVVDQDPVDLSTDLDKNIRTTLREQPPGDAARAECQSRLLTELGEHAGRLKQKYAS